MGQVKKCQRGVISTSFCESGVGQFCCLSVPPVLKLRISLVSKRMLLNSLLESSCFCLLGHKISVSACLAGLYCARLIKTSTQTVLDLRSVFAKAVRTRSLPGQGLFCFVGVSGFLPWLKRKKPT